MWLSKENKRTSVPVILMLGKILQKLWLFLADLPSTSQS